MDEVLGLDSNLDTGNTTGGTTSSSATSYFSIDGGNTNLVAFNQAGPLGGSDYGDRGSSATPRVQDAFATPGRTRNWDPTKIIALDVVGHTPATVTTAPEPAPRAVLATAFAAMLAVRCRRSTWRRDRARRKGHGTLTARSD